jgi:uncharacterized membrane protein YkvA (DUF1232 family)
MKDKIEEPEVQELSDGVPNHINENIITDDNMKYLNFYEKLKKKLTGFKGVSKGKFGVFTEYLFLLPDFFILLCRLSADSRVNKFLKTKIVAIIAYVIMPLDLLPDFIPVIGYVDDLVLVVMGLNMILNQIGQNILLDNWSGSSNMLEMLQKISNLAEKFLDKNLLSKIKKMLKK